MKLITMHLIVDVIFSVDCFLYNLSQEKKYDLLNFSVADVIFKQKVLIFIYSNEKTHGNILILI